MKTRSLHFGKALRAAFFILLLTVAGWTNATAQSFTVGDLTYSFNDDGASVTLTGHVDGISGQLVIPESVELYGTSYPVTAIGEYAFQYCYDLTGDLVIPNSVITIGRGAFYSCPSFTGSLIIGDAVQSIGFDAFSECYGFTGSLNVGNSVQTIGGYAFHNCSGFTGSLTIGNSVQTIDQNAFSGCTGFTGSLAIGNAVQTIGYDAFLDCSGFTGSLVIGNSVQTIGEYAFGNCSGFTGSLTISESVTQINDLAFYNCNGFTSLDYNAVNCNLYYSGWGGYHWLEYCSSLTTLTIGENVHVIPDNFLKDHSSLLGDLVIPNTVTTIGENAFYGCSGFTGSLNIPNSVTTISNSAFYGCSGFTGSLTIGNAVTTIGENAFNGCSGFTGSLTIPNSVTTIGSSAFLNCSGFSGTLTLGNSLTQIGNSAFFGACEYITSFEVWAETPPTLGNYVFLSANTGIPVYVPCSTLEAYQNASGWSNFTNFQEFNPCQWSIGATVYHSTGGTVNGAGIYEQGQTCTLTATPFSGFVFSRWTEDGEVVSTDATYSFVVEGNRNLVAYFTSPDFIVFADPNVEARCIALWDSNGDGYLSYDEAAAVTDLNRAFRYNDDITSFDELQYFTGLTSFNNYEFYSCDALTSVTLPESLTTISYSTFYCCYSLASVVIPESVTYIDGWAFAECYSLNSITLQSITPPEVSGDCPFCYIDMNNIVVTVPCNTTETYRNAYIWNEFNNYQEPNTCIYEITATLNYDDAGTVSGAGSYQSGATCTMTATPAANRMFLNWTENGEVVSTESEYSFTVLGDRALVANFSLPIYTITATANPTEGGTISISNSATDFDDGTLQGWTAIDADGDGRNWYVRSNGDSGDNYNLYGHSGSYFVASFSYYSGSINPDNYLISPEKSNARSIHYFVAGNYDYRDHYGVYASTTGNSIYDFSLVYEETIPSAKVNMTSWYERTVELPEGTKYVAFRHFNSYDMYFLLLDDILINDDNAFEQGSTYTLTAIPNNGYAFENWMEGGNVISTEAELSFTVTNDRDLVANFVQTPFTINATPNFDDRGTVSGAGEYVINQTCTLTATPNEGHNFVRWTENGEVVTTEASYSFTVDGSRDLVAVFTAHVDDIIVFADPDTKYVCVNNWDTDGDGELTYDEAAAVTDLWGFYGNYDINSFDELQYFTGLSYIGDWTFEHCGSLSSIVLPNSLTSIGSYAFQHCGSLSSIVLPNSLTSIGSCAFQHCGSLSSIVLPNSLTSIGSYAFYNCNGLRGELTLPESLESVGGSAFYGCDGITTVNYNATNCQTMGSAGEPVFYDCAFSHLRIGENVESIPDFAFKRCFLINEISSGAVVPPTIYASTFGMVSRSIPVHVPVGSGAAYRNAPYWEEFFNITEDYSSNTYTCHWTANANQFAYNMTAIGIIQIEGVEQSNSALEIGAFCGNECRGSQMLAHYPQVDRHLVFLTLYGEQGDLLTFRLYDHELGEESVLGCTSIVTFEPNGMLGAYNNPYVFNFTTVQNTALNEGWSWYSSYVELGSNSLQMMEEGLGDNGVMIKSQSSGFVTYDQGDWLGSLQSVNNESMYLINTNAPCVLSMTGGYTVASQHPVTLLSGWTWTGYPSAMASDINEALSDFEATDGDLFKTKDCFAIYAEGFGWFGSLQTLKPGNGMMYHSENGQTQSLVYKEGSRGSELRENITAKNNHLVPNEVAYPYNMNVIAVVELNGEELAGDNYELAAFANGECRGSAKLMYVAPLDRHMAFLTVAGDDATALSFGLYDAANGSMRFDTDNVMTYTNNAIAGSLGEPCVISFHETTGTSEFASRINVFPNPVARGGMLNIGLRAEDLGKVRVEIVNALGVTIESVQASSVQAIAVPETAGVYLLRITVEGEGTCYKKIVVR